MIKRIVKMTFKTENVSAFKAIYDQNWQKIKNSKGCLHVELLQDTADSRIFFTYSLWQSENDLENYRTSDLFNTVWLSTKILFDAKPEAWTLKDLYA